MTRETRKEIEAILQKVLGKIHLEINKELKRNEKNAILHKESFYKAITFIEDTIVEEINQLRKEEIKQS